MKTEFLKSFVAVVESKSFSVAAKRLFLSQPAISTHIKQLEEELGVQLLTRSTKNVHLTETGLAFYPYAQRLIRTESEAMFALHGKKNTLSGTVQIAASSVPANYILVDFISYMGDKYQDISFKISEGDSSEVIKNVLHFDTEIGVCGFKLPNKKCLYEELFTDDIVLITPKDPYFSAFSGKMQPEALPSLRFIVRETGSGTGLAAQNIERTLGLSERNMRVVAQVEGTELLKRSVAAGVGCAFISKLAAMDYVKSGKVLMFEFPDINCKRSFYLVHHRERILDQAAAITINELSEYCKKRNQKKSK
ncbi:MAG: selenium metabolism-associated LysR family transcriptional regulator [Candidatus Avilachnospira sp.]